MVYMLFDNPSDKESMRFLESYDETSTFEQIYPPEKCNSVKKMISACWKCLKQTNKNDTIVCWYDFMGVISWWLCFFTRRKRQIIILNILIKDKDTTRNKIAKKLYRKVLMAKNTQATVTSEEYGQWFNSLLKIDKQYYLLHDCFFEDYYVSCVKTEETKSVFCGGRNGRDWELLTRIASEMPDVVFYCIMPKCEYEKQKTEFTSNMYVQCDVPLSEYFQTMCKASLVAIPLDTEAPAGLIALFQAIANEKPVIVSDTVVTRTYFEYDKSGLCKNTVQDWKGKIRYYLAHKNETKDSVAYLKKIMTEKCSEQQYARHLARIVKMYQ